MTDAQNDEWRYGYYATVAKNHRFLEAIEKLFAERDDCHCLDLGCGPGYLARYIADRLCPRGRVTGIEPDIGVLRRAQERRTENLAFLAGVGQDLPFPDDTFDWVISNSVLEHIPHAVRRHAIVEAARALEIAPDDVRAAAVAQDWISAATRKAVEASVKGTLPAKKPKMPGK